MTSSACIFLPGSGAVCRGYRFPYGYLRVFGPVNCLLLGAYSMKTRLMQICAPVRGWDQLASRHQVPLHHAETPNSQHVCEWVKENGVDIILIMVWHILKKEIIELPRIGIINKHSALLPSYRGVFPFFWTRLKGDPMGITFHEVDAGIDTGAILLQERYRRRILALRIGGNDLFSLLGMRRPRGRTVYQTPLALTISQLVTTFRPHGFHLTAPVFEYLDSPRLLEREVRADLAHGLFGKTAIHPRQVPIIEANYRVSARDLHMAEEILAHAALPVFRLHEAMCEPATHRPWAEMICARARLYGVVGSSRFRRDKLPACP